MTTIRRAGIQLLAGAAKVDITPTWSLPLAGFASRRGLSAGVASPIFLRAAFLESRAGIEMSRAVVVSADLLWWPPEHVKAYRRQIADRFDVPEHAVVLAATHNHSAPQTSARFAPSLGLPDPRFVARLETALVEVVGEAKRALEPVTFSRGAGIHALGINRRALIDGRIHLAPNPGGPVDPELTVITLDRADGTPVCVFVHFACHPVISAENVVTSEFPGVAMTAIERQTGATAFFLQGCSGDINPASEDRTGFATGGEIEIMRAGDALATTALDVLRDKCQPLESALILSEVRDVLLPFSSMPSADEVQSASLRPGVDSEWGRAMLADSAETRSTAMLTMQRVDLARGISLLAVNAELVVEYGLHAKSVSGGTVLPVSCSNGMIGYVPTAPQIADGGYESDESTRYFLLPSRFSPDIEQVVRHGIGELAGPGRGRCFSC